jgi:Ca2+-binding EF-hand superfamily protein
MRRGKKDKKDKKKQEKKQEAAPPAPPPDVLDVDEDDEAAGAAVAGPAFVNPLRGRAVALEARMREQERAAASDNARLLQLAFDACDKDDGESDGNIGAKTAALMVHCVLPLVEVAGLLGFIQQLHADGFSEDAWGGGEVVYAAQRSGGADGGKGKGKGKGGSGGGGGGEAEDEPEEFVDSEAPKDGYAGEYRVLQAAATRETSQFSSEIMGELEPGEVLLVHEGLILPSGKVRLRSDKGWFSLINNAGDTLVERTDGQGEVGGDIAVLDEDTAAPEEHEIPITFEQVQRLVEMGARPKERSSKKKQEEMKRGLQEILMVANVFSNMDVNHTGRIDLLGLSQLSGNLKIGLTVSQLKEVWGVLCVDLDGDDDDAAAGAKAKEGRRISFEQFFQGLLHMRQLVAEDDSTALAGLCAGFRRGLLQRGSGPGSQVDVLMAALNQQRLDAIRAQRAIQNRAAADAAASAMAAKKAVEVLAKQSREQAASAAAKVRASEDAAEEQRRHEEEWLEAMERNQQEMGADYSAWVEENRNKLIEEPDHMLRRCYEGSDLDTMLRGVEMLRGVFAASDVLRVHRLEKRVCALLLTELGATASVSIALFQMEKAVHTEGEPVGTGIHHGHSLDFKEFFHLLANQKDGDRMRVATLDEDAILGLQSIGTAFTQIDTDGSGSIDRQEFDVLCAAMGAYDDPKTAEGGTVREMWLKLCGRKVELPFVDFLEQTLSARQRPLGQVFYEEVVWALRADDATELAAGWHVMEEEEQEERAQNPNWHHLDSTEEEEEEEEDDTEPAPEIFTFVPTADSYIDQARNPMTVRRTIDHLRVAFDSLDESDSMTDGTLGSDVVAFFLALLVKEWSEKLVLARIASYNLGELDEPEEGEGGEVTLRQLSFDDMVYSLICPKQAGKFEIEAYLGESEERLQTIACVAGCAKMFMAMDTDGSGKVDFSEFQVLVVACKAGLSTRDQRELWTSFERDRSNQCSLLGMMLGLQKLSIIGPAVRPLPLPPLPLPPVLLLFLTHTSICFSAVITAT